MKVLILSMALSATAFANLTFSLDPSTQVFPPGADASTCQQYSPSSLSSCVIFSGTLTDTDTDGSLIILENLSIVYGSPGDANFLTVDNLFADDTQVPGVLEGDMLDSVAGNSYTGEIFGVDIAPGAPSAVYNETAEILAEGGANDPNYDGFTVDVPFTVVVTPEPASGLMITAGLMVLIVSIRMRRN